MAKLNIKSAIKKPGALHAQMGVPKGKKIPAKALAKAAKAGGKLGQRARFAETLKGLKHAKGGKVKKYADGGEVSPFGKAFRAARKSGADTFDWNGKSYTTEWKEEQDARLAKAKGASAAPTPAQVKPAAATPAASAPAKAATPASAPSKPLPPKTLKDAMAQVGAAERARNAKSDAEGAAKAKSRGEAISAGLKKVGAALTPKFDTTTQQPSAGTAQKAAGMKYKRGGKVRRKYI